MSALSKLLSDEGVALTPLFGPSEERVISRAAAPTAEPVSDLARFYRVDADDARLDTLARKLSKLPEVEAAYVKPPAEPPIHHVPAPPLPEEAPPVTPDFTSRQAYLDVSPGGIDARFAWTRPGGSGAGVRIIDVEGAWRFTHEDLTQNQGGVVGGTQSTDIRWRNHGTAVVGEFSGDRNTIGITGICPDANVRAVSIFGASWGSAAAIRRAADLLGAGDVILIELHRPGPRHQFQSRDDQAGYIAVEWWPDDLAAIRYATGRGVIVVEAAGNGAENLADVLYDVRPPTFPATWTNPFRRGAVDSGAILAGAGAPPPGTHGRNHGPDRSRLDFSNYGNCVDVQGWGREVTTCSYGDLQGGTEDIWYTDVFSGTSSASPIVVGALGCLQGVLRAAGRPLLTPATARTLLRAPGAPQQDAPGRPATQRIGPRPNLRQAILQLMPKHKEAFKDKIEIKEGKIEIKEHLKSEIKEFKEHKEKEKELKEHHKELKDGKEHQKEIKEFKEKDKDIYEGGHGGGFGGPAGADLESRLSSLERTMQSLTHLIGHELRPDLGSSALRHEPDAGLKSMESELEGQTSAAKAGKDSKDVEFLR